MSSGLVLLYHRVAELESDPQLLAVSPERFTQHLDVLDHDCHPMSLTELMTRQRERRLPRRAVAVTFDDGYADNGDGGRHVLARLGIPAAIFVVTAYLGGLRELWWDDLERLLLLPGRLPETLRLRLGVTVHEWNLGEPATYTENDWRHHATWNVECAEDPTSRHAVYRTLCTMLRMTTPQEREAALDGLAEMAGSTSTGRSTHRAMSDETLARLAQDRLVEVGAHTVTHPVLAALSADAQRAEIAGSKSRLEEVTGRAVTSFAYPFGGRADYTPATVALVRESGFTDGWANIPGLVRPAGDQFQLPRVLVRNWDPDTFARRLRGWFRD